MLLSRGASLERFGAAAKSPIGQVRRIDGSESAGDVAPVTFEKYGQGEDAVRTYDSGRNQLTPRDFASRSLTLMAVFLNLVMIA